MRVFRSGRPTVRASRSPREQPACFRVDIGGGAPVLICNAPFSVFRGGSWGSDGQIIFAALIQTRRETPGLFRIPASGGEPILLSSPDTSRGEVTYRSPQILPDGHFLYAVDGASPESTGVYLASLARPAERVRVLSGSSKALFVSAAAGRTICYGFVPAQLWARSSIRENRSFPESPD